MPINPHTEAIIIIVSLLSVCAWFAAEEAAKEEKDYMRNLE